MEEQEMFDKVCSPRLEKIEKDTTQILKILIGDNDHPEKPGVCERIRKIESCYKKFRRVISWAALIIGGVWLTRNAPFILTFFSKLLTMKGDG